MINDTKKQKSVSLHRKPENVHFSKATTFSDLGTLCLKKKILISFQMYFPLCRKHLRVKLITSC